MPDMYDENNARLKAKKRIVLLLVICLTIAFVFIGLPFFLTFLNQNKENFVSHRVVTLYKTSVFAGLFFLVLAFGYLVPILIKVNRRDYGISEEREIMQSLEKYLPEGEILTAGVSGFAHEVDILMIFKNCIFDGERIIPSENGEMIRVNKGKKASFDVYIGITQNYLIFIQQKVNKWYYDIDEIRNAGEMTAIEVNDCVLLKDIGVCFPITEIQSCVVKKIWMGAVRCTVTMKNGSFLKFQLPKINGLPHYEEYRKAILDRLSSYAVK